MASTTKEGTDADVLGRQHLRSKKFPDKSLTSVDVQSFCPDQVVMALLLLFVAGLATRWQMHANARTLLGAPEDATRGSWHRY